MEFRITKGVKKASIKEFEVNSNKKKMSIGRSSTCDLQLSDSSVSKKHAEIIFQKDNIVIKDLGSSNGVFVNGQKIESYEINDGDKIHIGNFILQSTPLAPKVIEHSAELSSHEAAIPRLKFKNEDKIKVKLESSNISLNEKENKFIQLFNMTIQPITSKMVIFFDVRFLMFFFFTIWTLMVALFVAQPVQQTAQKFTRQKALEIPMLYGRQIARLNQQSLINEQYQDLITQIDSYQGQTQGIISSLIFDAQNYTLLSPADKIGIKLPKEIIFQVKNNKKEKSFFSNDYQSSYFYKPILARFEGKNIIQSAVLVHYSLESSQIPFISLYDNATLSMIFLIILGGFILLFITQCFNGSLVVAKEFLENNNDIQSHFNKFPVKWPSLKKLCEQLLFSQSQVDSENELNLNASTKNQSEQKALYYSCEHNSLPSFITDDNDIVICWNEGMEKITNTLKLNAETEKFSAICRIIEIEEQLVNNIQHCSEFENTFLSSVITINEKELILKTTQFNNFYLSTLIPQKMSELEKVA